MTRIVQASFRHRLLVANLALFAVSGLCVAACSDDEKKPPPSSDYWGQTPPPVSVPSGADASASTDGATEPDLDGGDASSDGQADANDPSSDGGKDAGADAKTPEGDPPPADHCRSSADCTDPKLGCFSYVEPNCNPETTTFCVSDDECGPFDAGIVCDLPRKGCGTACIPGCTQNSDCKLGFTCSDTYLHHCVPTKCKKNADCPNENFECKAFQDGSSCRRRECTKDSECAGRCIVEQGTYGQCFEDWGVCTSP